MGKRGPKPTPTALLKLRGSWRAGTRDGEPQAIPESVSPPSWLGSNARQYWDEICPMLVGWGVMAKPFGLALALLADAVADWVDLSRELVALDDVPTGESGDRIITPEELMTRSQNRTAVFRMKSDAWKRVRTACAEFGITPAAVTSVKKVEQKQVSPLDKFRVA